MVLLLLLGAILMALLFTRPRLALWFGLIFPFVQAFYSPTLLRPVILIALLVGAALGWRQAARRARDVVLYLWFGTALTLTLGWLLSVEPSRAEDMVVNLIYAAMVASLVVIYRMRSIEWAMYLMAWGTVVSAWLVTHDVVDTGRTGSLYIGENANALGMFAALGIVAAATFASTSPFRLPALLIALPVAGLCSLGLLASASRGALMVAISGIAVLIFAPALRASGARAVVSVVVLAASTIWIAVEMLEWFLSRAGRDIQATTNFDSREGILEAGMQAGLSHPLAGVGFGNLEASGIGIFGQVSPHNAYIGLFAAAGLIPTVLLAILVGVGLQRARKSLDERPLPLLVSGLVIGLSLDWVPTAKLGPIVLALLVCAATIENAERQQMHIQAGRRKVARRGPSRSREGL